MKDTWLFVDNREKLHRAMGEIGSASIIAIDTEYDSLRYFREKLCLIQVSTPSFTYLLDPLDGLDISFMGEVCRNAGVTKVLHAGVNDVRLLNRDFGFTFASIFDTERAAAMLGATRLALTSLLGDFLGVEMTKRKQLQRSRWDRRPLTEEQLAYAAEDTAHLIRLHGVLADLLALSRLEEKACMSFHTVARSRWTEKTLDPKGYLRLEGAENLDVRARQRLAVLYRWRFEKAKATNRPRFLLLTDQDLVALARADISCPEDLTRRCGLAPRKVAEFGEELTALLSKAGTAA